MTSAKCEEWALEALRAYEADKHDLAMIFLALADKAYNAGILLAAPSPKPSAEGTEPPKGLGICGRIAGCSHEGWNKPHVRNDACWNWQEFRPAPSGETRGTCDLQRNPVSLFKLHWTDHAEVDACVNWKPVAPEAVGTKEPEYCNAGPSRNIPIEEMRAVIEENEDSPFVPDIPTDADINRDRDFGMVVRAPGEAVGQPKRCGKCGGTGRSISTADMSSPRCPNCLGTGEEAVGRETRELTNDQQLTLSEADGPLYYIFEADCSFSVADPQPIHPLYVSTLRRERDQLLSRLGLSGRAE